MPRNPSFSVPLRLIGAAFGFCGPIPERDLKVDDQTKTELEAAASRRLVNDLRERTDVQNIDLMNLAGFCRNCLSNWYLDAAQAKGVELDKATSREIVYGMSYEDWKAKYQREASEEQKAAFEVNKPSH